MAALFIFIMSSSTFAGSVYFGGYTDHLVTGKFNEVNQVVIAQFDGGLTIGSMVNSYGRDSVMVGYVQDNDKPVKFGLVLATGYEPINLYLQDYLDSTPLVPMPLVSIDLNVFNGASITANWISGVVINAGVKFSF